MKSSVLTLAIVCLLGVFTPKSYAADLPIPDDVIFERDIEYTRPNGVSVMLNLARPKNITSPRPAVICIHGGGFRAGTREGYNKTILKLAQNGYVAATISYRLAPTNQFPAAVHDTKAAVRWMRANAAKYQVDPARIGVMGGSAGGHLVQFLGVTAGVPERVCPISWTDWFEAPSPMGNNGRSWARPAHE